MLRRKVEEKLEEEAVTGLSTGPDAQPDAELEPDVGGGADAEPLTEPEVDAGTESEPGAVPEIEPEVDPVAEPEVDPAPGPEVVAEADPDPGPEVVAEAEPEIDAGTEFDSGLAPDFTDSGTASDSGQDSPAEPVDPAPIARHSPEPQTPAERLTSSEEHKRMSRERRAASKRQRAADKAKRKADRKAAKEARKLAQKPPKSGSPDPQATEGSETAGLAAVTGSPEVPVELPPITPPGAAPGNSTRRTSGLIGGIDLGGTKIAAAVLDFDHNVVAYRRRPTPDRGGPADVVRAMAVTMQEAAIDAGTEAHKLLAVGVGSPGSVNAGTGAVSGAGNLPDWDGTFQLGMALQEELGTRVKVGNDVQVGTRAEFELGAGIGHSSLLGVFWGTGVGGGIIMDGQPMLGRGRAGEIGHTLVRRGGARGLNGLNGTVEAYAGRKAMEAKALREVKKGRKTKLFKLMKKHDKTHLTSAIWQRALDDGDELAEDLLNRAVAALSAGIASAVNLLDPEAVVIGGGLGVRFGDTLVPEIIAGMDKYLLNKDNPPDIKVAALGDEGGVIGASLLVREIVEANSAPST